MIGATKQKKTYKAICYELLDWNNTESVQRAIIEVLKKYPLYEIEEVSSAISSRPRSSNYNDGSIDWERGKSVDREPAMLLPQF